MGFSDYETYNSILDFLHEAKGYFVPVSDIKTNLAGEQASIESGLNLLITMGMLNQISGESDPTVSVYLTEQGKKMIEEGGFENFRRRENKIHLAYKDKRNLKEHLNKDNFKTKFSFIPYLLLLIIFLFIVVYLFNKS